MSGHKPPPDANAAALAQINLKLLQTFMLVAENRSFKEAADRANRSQSAISMQIKHLEDQLGAKLFNRTTRTVKLTPEGSKLFASTQRGLQEVGLGLRNVQEALAIRRGQVALACAPTIASTHLPRILAEFKRDYPGIKMLLSELKSADLYRVIEGDAVDFGIGPISDDPDLDFEPLLDDSLYAFIPLQMCPHDRRTITLAELSALPLLHYHTTTLMGAMFEREAAARGIALNVQYRCIQTETLVAMAEAGIGAAILTRSIVRFAEPNHSRVYQIVEPEFVHRYGIVRKRGKELSPAAERLAQLIRVSLREA